MKHSFLVLLLVLPAALRLPAQDRTDTETWRGHVKAAQELQRQGEIPHAEAEFRLAVLDAGKSGVESAALAHVFESMGIFYHDTGDFTQAEHCLNRALAIWRGRLGPEHPALSRVISRLAALYLETGQVKKAEGLGLESWIRRVEVSGPPGDDLIELIERLASLKEMRGQPEESERLYGRVLELAKERGSSSPADRAMAQSHLGMACLWSRRYDAAIEYLTAALETWKQARGPDDRDTGTASYSLARAYHAAGRPNQAEPLLKSALAVAEKSFGPMSLRTAAILETYAQLLREQNRKGEAKTMEARVRRVKRVAGQNAASRQVVDVSELVGG